MTERVRPLIAAYRYLNPHRAASKYPQVGRTRDSGRLLRMLMSLADKQRTWVGKPLECPRNGEKDHERAWEWQDAEVCRDKIERPDWLIR